jgi:hypothetical protein
MTAVAAAAAMQRSEAGSDCVTSKPRLATILGFAALTARMRQQDEEAGAAGAAGGAGVAGAAEVSRGTHA